MNDTMQLTFEALDTLFFREALPMDQAGGVELSSVFPPPTRTVVGAIRTLIGEALGVDWQAFKREESPLNDLLGTHDRLGRLRFRGPYLLYRGERLYPAPGLLLRTTLVADTVGAKPVYVRLAPDLRKPVHCDLGRVFLPALSAKGTISAVKPLEKAFLTGNGLKAVLSGATPSHEDVIARKVLYVEESRLGIGRDNRSGTVIESLLYQTRHLRLGPDPEDGPVQIGMEVVGLDDTHFLKSPRWIRFGGESRMASVTRGVPASLAVPEAPDSPNGIFVTLLTHARFGESGKPDWLPPRFSDATHEGAKCWTGTIAGVSLRLVSCVIGKTIREGGWDLARHCPRPVRSLIPAGSVYFFQVLSSSCEEAVTAIHGTHLGHDNEWGRGELAAGYW